jgi:hypothetical protein
MRATIGNCSTESSRTILFGAIIDMQTVVDRYIVRCLFLLMEYRNGASIEAPLSWYSQTISIFLNLIDNMYRFRRPYISSNRFPSFFSLFFIVHHNSKVFRQSRIFPNSQTNSKQPNFLPKRNNSNFTKIY